jgi:1-acyl-sn-glycerol-3-phosphate acyltransferase
MGTLSVAARLTLLGFYLVCQVPCLLIPMFVGKLFFGEGHRFTQYIRSLLAPLSTGVYLLFFSIKLSAQLSPNVPEYKKGISRFLLMSHSSTLDFMVVTSGVWLIHSVLGGLVCIVKKELFSMPFIGLIQRGAGSIPVARSGDLEAAKKNLAVGERRAREGYVIAGFPEGSRRRSPSIGREQLLPFKKGMFHMAKNVCPPGGKVQFVPLVMVGGNTAWPAKSILPVPGSKVTVRIGDPIDMKQDETVDEMVVRVRSRMQDEIEKTGAVLADGSYSVEAAYVRGKEICLWKAYGLEAVLMALPGLAVAFMAFSGML